MVFNGRACNNLSDQSDCLTLCKSIVRVNKIIIFIILFFQGQPTMGSEWSSMWVVKCSGVLFSYKGVEPSCVHVYTPCCQGPGMFMATSVSTSSITN